MQSFVRDKDVPFRYRVSQKYGATLDAVVKGQRNGQYRSDRMPVNKSITFPTEDFPGAKNIPDRQPAFGVAEDRCGVPLTTLIQTITK